MDLTSASTSANGMFEYYVVYLGMHVKRLWVGRSLEPI